MYYYGEFKFLQESKVGEFCNAKDELMVSQSINAAGILNKIVEYGIDAYDQYDYYCASSSTSCQITNEQVTKLSVFEMKLNINLFISLLVALICFSCQTSSKVNNENSFPISALNYAFI